MASNAIDAGIKLRPNTEDLKDLGPAFESRWNEYFADAPDKPVVWLGIASGHVKPYPVPPRKYLSLGYHTEYAASRGRVCITSGTDPHAPLNFDSGFLTEASDLAILRWAYKFGREIVRRMSFFRGEYPEGHPAFAADSEARCGEVSGPVEMSDPKIKYTAKDDEAIDEWNRRAVETCWHSLGTCAMKPRDDGGVVDNRLNVSGVQNLKVVGMSICKFQGHSEYDKKSTTLRM
ncbi:hypothetical protein HGRIS_003973 [Hohenbuehelia grisea]|uniref:Glucose-methanol-choline oxidoreductase C-terminal domain-containing protein n=1 Tax=Hohenbuehelia grisea TaxID=104357 RepID=A0ABR3JH35_9AGAR